MHHIPCRASQSMTFHYSKHLKNVLNEGRLVSKRRFPNKRCIRVQKIGLGDEMSECMSLSHTLNPSLDHSLRHFHNVASTFNPGMPTNMHLIYSHSVNICKHDKPKRGASRNISVMFSECSKWNAQKNWKTINNKMNTDFQLNFHPISHQKRSFYTDKQYIFNDLLEDLEITSRGTLSSKVINLMRERPSNFTTQLIKLLHSEPEESRHLVPFHAEIIYYCLMEYAPLDNLDQMEKLFQFFFVSNYNDFIADVKMEKNLALEDGSPNESRLEGDSLDGKTIIETASETRNAQFFDWNAFIIDIMEIRRLLSFDAPIRVWRNSLCFLPLLECYAYHGQLKHVNALIEASSYDMGFSILFDPKWGITIGNTVLKAFKHSASYLDMLRWFVLWYQCEENQRQAPLQSNEETFHIIFSILPSLMQLAGTNNIQIQKKDALFFYNIFIDAYESLLWQKKPKGNAGHNKIDNGNQKFGTIQVPPEYYLPYTKHFKPSIALNQLMLFLSHFEPEYGFRLFEECVQSTLNSETIFNKIPSSRLMYRSLMDCATKLSYFDRIEILEEVMRKDFEVFGRDDLNPRNENPLHLLERMRVHIRLGNHQDAFQLFYNNFQHSGNNFDTSLLEPNNTIYAVLLQGFSIEQSSIFWIIYQLCESDQRMEWTPIMTGSTLRWLKDRNTDAFLYLFTKLYQSPLQVDERVKQRLATFSKSNAYKEHFGQYEPKPQNLIPDLASISQLLNAFFHNDYEFCMHLLEVLQESFDYHMCTNVYNYLLYSHIRSLNMKMFWNLHKKYEKYVIERIAQESEDMNSTVDESKHDVVGVNNLLASTDPGNERTKELLEEGRILEHVLSTSKNILNRIL